MRRQHFLIGVALAAIGLGAGLVDLARADDDAPAIRRVLMAAFDKPQARLTVEPVVVLGAHALAGWTQGERGGRALLRRHGQGWQIAVCGGDGLKDPQALRDTGMSAGDATALARALTTAEAGLTPAQRAKFSTFDGMLRMDANGQHPPQHKP
jgi:hypothetical protein